MLITWKNFVTEILFLLVLPLLSGLSYVLKLQDHGDQGLSLMDALSPVVFLSSLLYSIIHSIRLIFWNKTNLRYLYILELTSTSIIIYLLITSFSFLPAQDEPEYLTRQRLDFMNLWYNLLYTAMVVFLLNLVIKLVIYLKQWIGSKSSKPKKTA